MDSFSAGDTVKLKSGGEMMTIKWIENGEAYCEWFEKSEVKGHKFSLVQFVKED